MTTNNKQQISLPFNDPKPKPPTHPPTHHPPTQSHSGRRVGNPQNAQAAGSEHNSPARTPGRAPTGETAKEVVVGCHPRLDGVVVPVGDQKGGHPGPSSRHGGSRGNDAGAVSDGDQGAKGSRGQCEGPSGRWPGHMEARLRLWVAVEKGGDPYVRRRAQTPVRPELLTVLVTSMNSPSQWAWVRWSVRARGQPLAGSAAR